VAAPGTQLLSTIADLLCQDVEQIKALASRFVREIIHLSLLKYKNCNRLKSETENALIKNSASRAMAQLIRLTTD